MEIFKAGLAFESNFGAFKDGEMRLLGGISFIVNIVRERLVHVLKLSTHKVTHKVLRPYGISEESSYHRSNRQRKPLWELSFHVCHDSYPERLLLLSTTLFFYSIVFK